MDGNIVMKVLSFVDDYNTAVALLRVGGKECFEAAHQLGYIKVLDLHNKPLKVGVQYKNQHTASHLTRGFMRKFKIRRRFECCCQDCCREAEKLYCVPTTFTKPKDSWGEVSNWIYFMTNDNAAFLAGLFAIWQMYLSTFNIVKITNVTLCNHEDIPEKTKIILGAMTIGKHNVVVPLNTPSTLLKICRHL